MYGTIRNQRHPISAFEILELSNSIVNTTVDISDRQQVYDLLNSIEPDVIFHLAAKALVPVSLRDPRRTFDVNLMGTLNIIEACRKLRVCNRLLICSTDHVFGSVEPHELPVGGFPERSRVSYGGPYDTSKAAMELMARSYHFTYWSELPAIGISRCANVFGPGDTNQRRVVPDFVQMAMSDRSIRLRARENGRQFIHVTDAVAGYLRAAASLDEGGARDKVGRKRPGRRTPFTPTFHFAIEGYVGTSEPFIRIAALAGQVAQLYGARVDDASSREYALNENKVQALNCRATAKALDWFIRKPFDEGLAQLGAWYQAATDRSALRELMQRDVSVLMENLGHR